MRLIRTNILNPVDSDTAALLKDHVIGWEDGVITVLEPYNPMKHTDYEDNLNCVTIPGLIDIHVHLSQYRIRGRYEPALLKWLDKYVFPEEALSANDSFAQELATEFFQALFAAGTTTSVIYTAPYFNASVAAFETAQRLGARALIGMTMMDQNCPDNLKQNTEEAVGQSIELYQQFHSETGLLDYIFTPRFAISCSRKLMKSTAEFASSQNAWIQTHLSENHDEIKQTLQLFDAKSYTELYNELGLLRARSIFAHAIHLDERELDLLAAFDCRIAHCPDSNFFLKSGEFHYQTFAERGMKVGLGSDVGAGTSLSMLHHMKMASYRQSIYSIKPEKAFYLATLGSAQALDMEGRIGSLQIGKDADLCSFKLPSTLPQSADELASMLCYLGGEFTIKETIIAGRSVYSS